MSVVSNPGAWKIKTSHKTEASTKRVIRGGHFAPSLKFQFQGLRCINNWSSTIIKSNLKWLQLYHVHASSQNIRNYNESVLRNVFTETLMQKFTILWKSTHFQKRCQQVISSILIQSVDLVVNWTFSHQDLLSWKARWFNCFVFYLGANTKTFCKTSITPTSDAKFTVIFIEAKRKCFRK